MMTCVSFALLDKADDGMERRIGENKLLQDHLIGREGSDFLLATSEETVMFEGVKTLQMRLDERKSEDLTIIVSEGDVDYSMHSYHAYADPFNTPGLVEDHRIGDGFIFKADRTYDSPEDNLRLLRAIKSGEKVRGVYRKDGIVSALMDSRTFMARTGPFHPTVEDLLKPFKARGKGGVKAHLIAFNVKKGKITVDNTFKPKTVKVR
ncbi:MAG: fructose 1,6-bisphosphatase [Candidatus Altiarchaeales archaeon]|nr:fructose 1,6-bisphosphatase [Candidatus Altiarchaeales archaeon]MBD3416259.1 fructose 1,6-bisphosphatase [Candidatus Altiarchaeales archaeon]